MTLLFEAPLADGNLEVVLLVAAVRSLPADVPLDSRASEVRPAEGVGHGEIRGNDPDGRGAIGEDLVEAQKVVELVDDRRELRKKLSRLVRPAVREIVGHSPDPVVVVEKPGAA